MKRCRCGLDNGQLERRNELILARPHRNGLTSTRQGGIQTAALDPTANCGSVACVGHIDRGSERLAGNPVKRVNIPKNPDIVYIIRVCPPPAAGTMLPSK